MRIVVFEDSQVEQLYPITIGRPAFAVSCGSYRLIDILRELSEEIRSSARPHLWETVLADFPDILPSSPDASGLALFVNARLVPSVATRETLRRLIQKAEPGFAQVNGSVAAALTRESQPSSGPQFGGSSLEDHLRTLDLPAWDVELPLLSYPHDVLRNHLAILPENLQDRIQRKPYREVRPGVFAVEGAEIGDYVVTDTRDGPIVLEKGANVGPYCLLRGPVHVGEKARILEHASLKDAVALGHTTKVGGEVEASIIEPYTNKQHHGFLGHSYLGSWINLGAGTCNSDLKNTYGTVNMEYNGRRVASNMQFVGCIVGDYSKTAINTSIFTGKVIGVCSMLYGFVTTNVPSFVNYARSFGQISELPVDVMVQTQARMFARRNVEQRPCDVQLLHAMYALTGRERQLAGEPLSL